MCTNDTDAWEGVPIRERGYDELTYFLEYGLFNRSRTPIVSFYARTLAKWVKQAEEDILATELSHADQLGYDDEEVNRASHSPLYILPLTT